MSACLMYVCMYVCMSGHLSIGLSVSDSCTNPNVTIINIFTSTTYNTAPPDESFEQALSFIPEKANKSGAYIQHSASMGWQNITSGGPGVAWVDNHTIAFNGNVSVTLRKDAVTGSRVGVAARGLYHHGYRLYGGKSYVGYIAVMAERPSTLYVRLEDWQTNPSAGPNRTQQVLAQNALRHPGDGTWHLFNLSLTPNASTSCVPFPFGQPPLYCSIPDSQVTCEINPLAS